MKAIKLVILFILILGGVLAALWLSQPSKRTDLADFHSEVAKDLEADILQTWGSLGHWDENSYESIEEKVMQNNRSEVLEEEEAQLLMELQQNAVCNTLHDALFQEFHSPTCSREGVKSNYAGVKFLCDKNADYKKDDRMVKVTQCYTVYANILRFVDSSYHLNPEFDGEKCVWNSFDAHRSSVKRRAETYQGDATYREHLSKIEELKSGWNEIDDKLNRAEHAFYNQLVDEISAYYRGLDATKEQVDGLEKIQIKLQKELSGKAGNYDEAKRRLQQFIDNFKRKI